MYMYMYVYVYICIYICIYIFIYLFIYLFIHSFIHSFIYLYIYILSGGLKVYPYIHSHLSLTGTETIDQAASISHGQALGGIVLKGLAPNEAAHLGS